MSDPAASGAVVVVNYGDPSVLLENPVLRAGAPWHVVVVDNLSTTQHRVRARALAAEHGWELLEPAANLGFGRGVNLGVQRAADAGRAAVLVVNPDAALEPEAAASLVRHALAHPDHLAAPLVVRPDGSTWFAGAWLDLRTGRTTGASAGKPPQEAAAWLSGACLATTTSAWQRVGGFAGDYFLYWEDIDLSVRWARAGGRLEVLHDVLCTHAVGGTQHAASSRAKSSAYYYYNCRNRLLFAARQLRGRNRWRWAWGALPYARSVVLRGGRRQLVRPGPTVGAALRGTAAGLGLLMRARTTADAG